MKRVQIRTNKVSTLGGTPLVVVVREDLEVRKEPSVKERVVVNPWRKGIPYLIHPEI